MASISMLRAFAEGNISSLTEEAYLDYTCDAYMKNILTENAIGDIFNKAI